MRLTDCFVKTLAYTDALRRGQSNGGPDPEAVRADYETLWTEADRLGGSFVPDDYLAAKFAVCAFVDEAILLSDWEGRDRWKPFQRRFFNTYNAGEEFFKLLGALLPDRREVREVFGLCLAMGFTGKYFEGPDEELGAIKEENVSFLLGSDMDEFGLNELCPEAYPAGRGGMRRRIWGRLSPLTVVLVVLPPALLVTLFALYRFSLGRVIFDFFTAG
jgi:type VI secretion system protein ImpK